MATDLDPTDGPRQQHAAHHHARHRTHARIEPKMGLIRPSGGENGPTECGESLVSGRTGAAWAQGWQREERMRNGVVFEGGAE